MIFIFLLFLLILILVLIIICIKNCYSYNNIYGGKHKKFKHKNLSLKKFTYKLYGSNNNEYLKYLKMKLNFLGWVEAHKHAKYVDLAYRVEHFKDETNKEFYYIKSDLKSVVANPMKLGYKDSLYKLMKKSPYIPKSETINNYIWNGDIIIVREVESQKQKGIYIIIDENEFIIIRDKLLQNSRAICSTYIKNPLLYKGKKFHLRIIVTFFIDKNGNKKISYMKNYIRLSLTKNKYIIKSKEDYLDPDMNISGVSSNCFDIIIWPEDQNSEYFNSEFFKLEFLSGVHNQVIDIAFFNKCNQSIRDAIYSIPLDGILLKKGQNAGFYTYGADIMLDDTGHAWILELNSHPGFFTKIWKDNNHDAFLNYLSKLYDFHLNEFILPYFSH